MVQGIFYVSWFFFVWWAWTFFDCLIYGELFPFMIPVGLPLFFPLINLYPLPRFSFALLQLSVFCIMHVTGLHLLKYIPGHITSIVSHCLQFLSIYFYFLLKDTISRWLVKYSFLKWQIIKIHIIDIKRIPLLFSSPWTLLANYCPYSLTWWLIWLIFVQDGWAAFIQSHSVGFQAFNVHTIVMVVHHNKCIKREMKNQKYVQMLPS